MGTLYLVRHGQASFGAADYDRLSALGERQSVRLGAYWRERGVVFNAVLTGTLRRHRQTWAGIAAGLGFASSEGGSVGADSSDNGKSDATVAGTPPPVAAWPGLNEYDGAALVEALGVAPGSRRP